jgi:long-chain fatty acid transport protein
MKQHHFLAAAISAAILLPVTAMATNGMFLHGNGTKANGRGGVGIAIADSAISGADNPAAMVRLGNRVDFGLQVFQPDRETTVSGNNISQVPLTADILTQLNGGLQQQGLDPVGGGTTYSTELTAGGQPIGLNVADFISMGPPFNGSIDGDQFVRMFNYDGDGNNDGSFYLPEGGINFMLNNNMSLGVTVVGAGGMNTNYDNLNLFSGGEHATTGINLEQLKILPTLSYKINEQHSVGVSLQVAYQQFKAWGLNAFTNTGGPFNGQVSQAPNKLSGKGRDDAWGFGLSVGWQGQITDRFTLGVVYNSEIDMDEFDDYKGLFSEDGSLDIPENYGIGMAFQATSDLSLGFDVQQINYSDVKAIANNIQSGNGGFNMVNPANYLGTNGGSGFGWDDMTVYKLGAEYQMNDNLLLRAGWSHSDQPISKDQTMFNILAPATIEDHGTIGMTYTLPTGSQISMFYMHAFEEKVKGRNSIPASFGGGEADIQMSQDAWGMSYGWNF